MSDETIFEDFSEDDVDPNADTAFMEAIPDEDDPPRPPPQTILVRLEERRKLTPYYGGKPCRIWLN